ncbi:ABC transporter ATP-binding protein [Rhizobium sp. C4]|uniref:ABC transporter ATP-binding protein n=1 Tax=Rhizobium sp. C4 TaxID=1349800 RepID=UPI001E464986|nr:ABC transporter ATP-binding protein [Rhizobium sp. C4]MCD2171444.1 ABC transporter ATP-binding protein [Rhizobium sp. C4]
MTAVSIKDLEIQFGSVKVLQNLNLDIASGEFIVLLGSSGCGKSTLLNSIAGLIDVHGGKILIGDKDMTHAEPKDRGIGMVFQSYALYPQTTVEGNLTFGLRMAKLPKDEIERRVARVSDMLQIKPYLKRRPAALSGGQRQRVAIGRALVRDADVYLFDEPLSNLDAKLRAELRVELKTLHEDIGKTMIYVTHDQVEAMTLATRIAVMQNGVIQQLASPEEIYNRPANLFVADFIGSPAMNFLSGTLGAVGERVEFRLKDGHVLDVSAYPFAKRPSAPMEAILGIRPEHLAISPREGLLPLDMAVNVIETMGADTVIWGTCGAEKISVRVNSELKLNPPRGSMLKLGFSLGSASLFSAADGLRL